MTRIDFEEVKNSLARMKLLLYISIQAYHTSIGDY